MNMTAEQFNEKYPVGTDVVYQSVKGGEGVKTKTRSMAWNLGHGEAVVAVIGVAGGVSVGHCTVLSVNETGKAK